MLPHSDPSPARFDVTFTQAPGEGETRVGELPLGLGEGLWIGVADGLGDDDAGVIGLGLGFVLFRDAIVFEDAAFN